MGREDFIEPQWDEGEKRKEMLAFFRAAFRQKTMAEWTAELAELEICFGPVNTLDETFADPQLRHRGMIVEMASPTGPATVIGPPIKLSDTPASLRTPPPTFGEHTEDVLRRLGYSGEQIVRLREDGVV